VSKQDSDTGFGLAVISAVGFGAGLLFGLVMGGWLGDVHPDRVKRAVGRLRSDDSEEAEDEELDRIEQELLQVLEQHPATRHLDLAVRALGGGLVELTGTAPDEPTRDMVADLARGVGGADVIVNRVLVEGTDTNEQSAVVS
jgi:uncharacterized protein YejL (UPF0352 family)